MTFQQIPMLLVLKLSSVLMNQYSWRHCKILPISSTLTRNFLLFFLETFFCSSQKLSSVLPMHFCDSSMRACANYYPP